MKRIALIAGIFGLTLFCLLLLRAGLPDIGRAVQAAGWATLVVVGLRVIALAGAGLAWHVLYPVEGRLSPQVAILLRFVREGVNQLLPVGAIGGDVVGARLATFWRADAAQAAAVTIADVAIQAATQAAFALVGVALLLWLVGDGDVARFALAGTAIGLVAIAGFFLAQARLGSQLLTRVLRRLGLAAASEVLVERLWRAFGAVYSRPARVLACGGLHLAMWFVGALEVYVVLHAMGYPIGFAEAVVIESLGQAVRGAAFAVPGGIGVQEGGFIALCALFVVPAGPALALSLVKRVADFVLGVPFLFVWQAVEGRRALRRPQESPQ